MTESLIILTVKKHGLNMDKATVGTTVEKLSDIVMKALN